jgi:hypothetical protein
MKKKVTLKRIFHRDKWCIGLFFDFDEKLKELVRSIPGSVYSSTYRCFYVTDSEENLKLILKTLKDAANIDISFLVSREELSGETESPPNRVSKVIHPNDQELPGDEESVDNSQEKTIVVSRKKERRGE